ncbi:uncharacterized protein LOC124799479 [Schistocerca piceifrons]|uniref:uncharacterized protein LOC124799479 n=1 Tax=Schistocerca piceifrons TaxID=274613 RepID=UPI001F5F3DD7|nr:uncharacterized protein LOC124799479 [Schistocerca piceifrons]
MLTWGQRPASGGPLFSLLLRSVVLAPDTLWRHPEVRAADSDNGSGALVRRCDLSRASEKKDAVGCLQLTPRSTESAVTQTAEPTSGILTMAQLCWHTRPAQHSTALHGPLGCFLSIAGPCDTEQEEQGHCS